MTPTIALIAVSLITAGLCVAVGIMQWIINDLESQIDQERARHEVTNELLTEARNEAKNEYDLRRQAEKNLAEANEDVDIHRERVFILQRELSNYSSPRDPKTGRFYSVKPRPTAQEMERGLAAFDTMMGNAIDQLNALTVRKMPDDMQTESALNMGRTLRLCDEVKQNAGSGI